MVGFFAVQCNAMHSIGQNIKLR